jgi:predicted lipoprotein with Yx(FWY)xxD motif
MRRLLLPLLTIAGLVAAGCGSSGGGGGSAATSATVNLHRIDGVGSVLVDSSGTALYSPAQESSGMIRCSGPCTKIWVPLAASGNLSAGSGVTGKLASIKRPDGTMQVTYDGRPLYTFVQDGGPGNVTGNGTKDAFGGTSFTWHAVTAKGAAASGGAAPKSGGYGY